MSKSEITLTLKATNHVTDQLDKYIDPGVALTSLAKDLFEKANDQTFDADELRGAVMHGVPRMVVLAERMAHSADLSASPSTSREAQEGQHERP